MPKLTLSPADRTRLETWLNEPGGLEAQAADPAFLNATWNNTPNPDNLGLTEVEMVIGQRDMYRFLLANDGKNWPANQWLPLWRTVVDAIEATLDKATGEGRGTAERTQQLNFFRSITGF